MTPAERSRNMFLAAAGVIFLFGVMIFVIMVI